MSTHVLNKRQITQLVSNLRNLQITPRAEVQISNDINNTEVAEKMCEVTRQVADQAAQRQRLTADEYSQFFQQALSQLPSTYQEIMRVPLQKTLNHVFVMSVTMPLPGVDTSRN